MTLLDSARLFIYRCREKGLEVLLVSDGMQDENWSVPAACFDRKMQKNLIELESFNDQKGQNVKAYAIEADWHDIPSVRAMIRHDVNMVKSKIKESVVELEKGTYFGIRDALKRVLPDEYNALKELKDILLDRNLTTSI